MLQILFILALVLGVSIIVPHGARKLTCTMFRIAIWLMFFIYVVGNMYCTLFSRIVGSGVTVELRPFMSVVRLFGEPIQADGNASGLFAWFMSGSPLYTGIFLNILLYYPLGYMLPLLFPKLKSAQIILIGCLCSITTEVFQYLLKMGWCETDDVLHNTFGTVIGVWVWYMQSKQLKRIT